MPAKYSQRNMVWRAVYFYGAAAKQRRVDCIVATIQQFVDLQVFVFIEQK